jgi:Amt family ammonium transporter
VVRLHPGSTLGALDGRFTEVVIVTQLAACAGVLSAIATAKWKTGAIDIGMAGNGAIAALVAITAPSATWSRGPRWSSALWPV